jgi:hypothetical protein
LRRASQCDAMSSGIIRGGKRRGEPAGDAQTRQFGYCAFGGFLLTITTQASFNGPTRYTASGE